MQVPALPIQIRDGQLKDGRKGDPEEVRDVGEGDPLHIRIHGDERPDERTENEEDVYGGEGVILKSKLEIGVREIENEVEQERQSDDPRQGLSDKRLIEDLAERDRDNRVQHRPHGAKYPRRRRPRGLDELLVRGVGSHKKSIATKAPRYSTALLLLIKH